MMGAVQVLGLFTVIGLAAVLATRLFFARYAREKVSAVPLAVFRIAYGSVLFLEVCQLFRFRHLVFDPVPYVVTSELGTGYLLGAWLVAIACVIVGLYTRVAAVASYTMTLATFGSFSRFEYHLDYVLTGINLLIVFMPVSRALSLDRLLESRSTRGETTDPAEVDRIHPELLVLVGIGLVYFDSIFYKLASPMWTSGLGVWLPASLPQVTWLDLSPVLDQKWLVLGLGYLTLVFESLFLALVWFDRLRPALLAIGLGLHLGIGLAFPIPWFALGVVALYVLLVPPAWFAAAERLLRTRGNGRRAGASRRGGPGPDAADPALGPAARAGLAGLLVWILASQGLATLQAPLAGRLAATLGLEGARRKAASIAREYTNAVSRPVAGLTRHGVFMDGHFRGYDQMISLVHVDDSGRETWLPIYGVDGLATAANSGRTWVFWNWRVVGTRPDRERLADGIRRLTAFWAHRRALRLRDLRFEIRARTTEAPLAWERGLLGRQRERPWRRIGLAGWRDGEFWSEIGPLERPPGAVARRRGAPR